MSKHDVEKARMHLKHLTARSTDPTGPMAVKAIKNAIDLLEHQTERVMELEREVERLNTIIERDANATELIAKKLCDKEREVERLHQKSDAWREEYRKMQEDGWRFEWYDQDEWVYGDWVFDPDCGGKDSYRIAHGPILEGWEYAGYKLAKAGEKWWDDLCDGWITCRCDHEGKTALSHCIRRKEPVDIPPNESDIGKPVMMRDADNMTWIKKTLALIGPNSMTYRYLSSFHDVPYSYRGFKQARKCREGE